MKRFQFELEKIQRLREGKEREARLELGRAVGILSELENRIRRIAEEKLCAAAGRFSGGNYAAGGSFASAIRSYEMYIIRLDQTRDGLLEKAARAELDVETARNDYLEARRECKVVEKIRERRKKEYRRAAFAEEIRNIDDISGGRPARAFAAGQGSSGDLKTAFPSSAVCS